MVVYNYNLVMGCGVWVNGEHASRGLGHGRYMYHMRTVVYSLMRVLGRTYIQDESKKMGYGYNTG